jgi:hypothetical protein
MKAQPMSKVHAYLVDRFVECTGIAEYRHIVPETVLREACTQLSNDDFQKALAEAHKTGMLTLLSIENGQRYLSRGFRLWHAKRKAA